MPAFSPTQVCNLGLRQANIEPITSFDAGTREADLCKEYYQLSRAEILEEHSWSFATLRATLAQAATAPLGEDWLYRYALPAAYIAMQAVIDYTDTEYRIEADEDNRYILTNASTLMIRYTFDQDNTALWAPSFIEAVGMKVATYVVGPVKRSRTDWQRVTAMYESSLARAKTHDNRNKTPIIDREELVEAGR